LKDQFIRNKTDTSDQEAFVELTKVNNELANLQRELSKKNVELRKLMDIKNHFLGMAAHDLRNPLGHIYNYADLIENETKNLTLKQLNFLHIIKSVSQSMADMVNEMLDYSVIESGHINLKIDTFDLVEILVSTIELHKRLAEKKMIDIKHFSTLPTQEINIDRGKIEQVMSNLITNAIKYSNPNSSIKIYITDKKDSVEVEVKDEGQGMTVEETETLFRPFQTTSAVTTAGETSTGLGLFISKRIIEAHQGTIWVNSKKNVGSEFYFTLPKKTFKLEN
jgi:signal transduction histidine kinase